MMYDDNKNSTMNFHGIEKLTLTPVYNLSIYDPSPEMKAFYAVMFLILETLGNFLLVCMIVYEKYGMDAQKRNVTNQLLTSIWASRILHNTIVIPLQTIERIFWFPFSEYKTKELETDAKKSRLAFLAAVTIKKV